MTYKSNIFKCMLDFIGLALVLFIAGGFVGSFYWLFILEGEVGASVTREVVERVLVTSAIGSGAVAAFLAFYIRRIRVVVTAEAVAFSAVNENMPTFPMKASCLAAWFMWSVLLFTRTDSNWTMRALG